MIAAFQAQFNETITLEVRRGIREYVTFPAGHILFLKQMYLQDRESLTYTLDLFDGTGRVMGVPERAFNVVSCKRTIE